MSPRDGDYPSRRYSQDVLRECDPILGSLLELERTRQRRSLVLSAATSILDHRVLAAFGSALVNVDSEGYPPAWLEAQIAEEVDLQSLLADFHRGEPWKYNGGTFVAAVVEALACKRVASVFGRESGPSTHAIVQPLSGSIAMTAVLRALVPSGGRILGLDLPSGGHLSHGAAFHISGEDYVAAHYRLTADERAVDYNGLERLARKFQPHVIIAGFSSFPRVVDWQRLAHIAGKVATRCHLIADISHVAGLVAADLFPSPTGHADVVVFATYKTLLGPRGAAVLWEDASLSKQLRSAVFPGLQSAPNCASIAALASALWIAASTEFRDTQQRIVNCARWLSDALIHRGLTVAFGGTDSHMVVLDFRDPMWCSVKCGHLVQMMDRAGIVCNANLLPGDTVPKKAKGVRLGTTWVGQLGMGQLEMEEIAHLIKKTVKIFISQKELRAPIVNSELAGIQHRVQALVRPFWKKWTEN